MIYKWFSDYNLHLWGIFQPAMFDDQRVFTTSIYFPQIFHMFLPAGSLPKPCRFERGAFGEGQRLRQRLRQRTSGARGARGHGRAHLCLGGAEAQWIQWGSGVIIQWGLGLLMGSHGILYLFNGDFMVVQWGFYSGIS